MVFVKLRVGGLLDVADHADGHGQVAAHAGQHHVDAGVLGVLVVHHDVVNGDAVLTDGHRFQATSVETQTLVLLLAEDHGFAVLKDDGTVVAHSAVGDGGVGLDVGGVLRKRANIVEVGVCHLLAFFVHLFQSKGKCAR